MRTFLSDTEQHQFVSATRGRQFVVSVTLPENYKSSDKRYPVVYVLDGDALFGMVGSLTVPAVWTGEIPELIAVCIGYGVDSYDEWGELRELDLALPGATTHDVSDPVRSPHPEVFLAALTDEIVPFIDRMYRTDPDDRCLFGYSWAGFFVLYALLQQVRTFHRYLSGGAFVEVTRNYLCREARRLQALNSRLAAQVFVGMSEHEAPTCVTAMREFVDTLATASGPDFRLASEVYPSEAHNSAAIALTYLHGLRAVYA